MLRTSQGSLSMEKQRGQISNNPLVEVEEPFDEKFPLRLSDAERDPAHLVLGFHSTTDNLAALFVLQGIAF